MHHAGQNQNDGQVWHRPSIGTTCGGAQAAVRGVRKRCNTGSPAGLGTEEVCLPTHSRQIYCEDCEMHYTSLSCSCSLLLSCSGKKAKQSRARDPRTLPAASCRIRT